MTTRGQDPDIQEIRRELEDRLRQDLERVRAAAQIPPCAVTVTNALPPDWGVVVIAAATQFNYQDANGNPEGNPTIDQKDPIAVVSGQSVTMLSAPDRCVRSTVTVIYAQAPGEDPASFFDPVDGDAQHCLQVIPISLAANQATEQRKRAEGGVLRLVEVSRKQ